MRSNKNWHTHTKMQFTGAMSLEDKNVIIHSPMGTSHVKCPTLIRIRQSHTHTCARTHTHTYSIMHQTHSHKRTHTHTYTLSLPYMHAFTQVHTYISGEPIYWSTTKLYSIHPNQSLMSPNSPYSPYTTTNISLKYTSTKV